MKEEQIVEKIKQQTQELWNTIQEAKKIKLKVTVGFEDFYTEPDIKISKVLYSAF